MHGTHDGVTRFVLSDAARMRTLLTHLPDPPLPWVSTLDTLVHWPDGFGEESPGARRADIVFAGLPAADGTPRTCLVFENQSIPLLHMPMRALWCTVQVLRDFRETFGHEATLPEIHIVVFYHGEKPWRGPLALYVDDDDARRSSINCRFHLIDLNRISDEDIQERLGTGLLTLGALVLKHGRRPGMGDKIPAWDRHFAAALDENGGMDGVRACIDYLLDVSDVGLEEIEALPFVRDSWEVHIMLKTTGRELREEGRLVGRAQGLEEGRAEGRAKERREMLRLLLLRLFDGIPEDLETRIAKASPATLTLLIEAAFEVDDPSDLLNV